MKRVLLAGFFTLFIFGLQGQERLSLEQCVQLAQRNSLSIKQAQIGISQSELTLKGNQLSRLPSLNGNFGGGFQFGRTIDPTTDAFITEAIGSNSVGLNSGVMLFNGNAINNSIKQSKMDLEEIQYYYAEMERERSVYRDNARMWMDMWEMKLF